MVVNTRHINAFLLFGLVVACYLQRFYFDMGFALKPFIVMSVVALIISLYINGYTNMTCLYERLFLGFVAASTLRGAVSLDVGRYFRSTLALIVVMLLYLSTSQVVARLSAESVFRIFFAASLLFLVLSLVIFWSVPNIGAMCDRGVARLRGTTIDPNIFVVFVIPIFAWSLSELLSGKVLALPPLALALLASALTLSRGGAIALLVTAALVLMKLLADGRKVWLALLLTCTLVACVVAVTQTGVIPWQEFKARSGLEDGSGRLVIWRHGVELFSTNPWFGIGLDNFRAYNDRLFHHRQYMHNTYLEVLVENGLVGFVLFAGSIVALLLHHSRYRGAGWVKIALSGQLVAVFFLSGLTLEAIFLVAGMYKGLSLRERMKAESSGGVLDNW